MRSSQLLPLLVVTFLACCSYVATAEVAVQVSRLEIDTTSQHVINEGRRSLKGSTKTTDVADKDKDEERIGATTPSFKQLFGVFRLPKFQSLSKVPGIKQLNAIRQKFGEKAGKIYLAFEKRRYESNMNNFL